MPRCRWQSKWQKLLTGKALAQLIELFEIHPVNAIHWTGIDGFLDPLTAITVLANHPRSPVVRLNDEGVTSHMSAVTTSDANGLINPDRLLPQLATE